MTNESNVSDLRADCIVTQNKTIKPLTSGSDTEKTSPKRQTKGDIRMYQGNPGKVV
jgi:hypothetical protein